MRAHQFLQLETIVLVNGNIRDNLFAIIQLTHVDSLKILNLAITDIFVLGEDHECRSDLSESAEIYQRSRPWII